MFVDFQNVFCLEIFIIVVLVATSQSQLTTSTMLPGLPVCNQTSEPVHQKAYLGWPVSLGCDLPALDSELAQIMAPHWWSTDYDYPAEGSAFDVMKAECQVLDVRKNTQVYSYNFTVKMGIGGPHSLRDVILEKSTSFQILIKIPTFNVCVSTILHVKVSPLPNLTCEESINMSGLIKRAREVEKSVKFYCKAPASEGAELSLTQRKRAKHQWLRNCAEIPEHSVEGNINVPSITIRNVTYEHSGIYTCAVMHNNQIRYISHQSLCVKPAIKYPVQHTITCTGRTIFATIGQKVALQCASNGSFPDFHAWPFLQVEWRKANETRCQNGKSSPLESGVKCDYDVKPVPCFTRTPTEEELEEVNSQKMSMTLTIENVQESDFGEYEIILTDINPGLPGSPQVTRGKITLVADTSQWLIPVYVTIGVLCGVAIIIGVCAVMYHGRRKLKKCAAKRKESMEDTSTITETV